jgi:hypothetical protein
VTIRIQNDAFYTQFEALSLFIQMYRSDEKDNQYIAVLQSVVFEICYRRDDSTFPLQSVRLFSGIISHHAHSRAEWGNEKRSREQLFGRVICFLSRVEAGTKRAMNPEAER